MRKFAFIALIMGSTVIHAQADLTRLGAEIIYDNELAAEEALLTSAIEGKKLVAGIEGARLVVVKTKKSSNPTKRIKEKVREEGTRIINQGEKTYDRIEGQTKTNISNLGENAKRDVRNTFRLFSESPCEREGRKNGPAAQQKCEREEAGRPAPSSSPVYSVSFEIECWKPGRAERWGTVQVEMISKISKREARVNALRSFYNKKVCQTVTKDSNLIDDENFRWIVE